MPRVRTARPVAHRRTSVLLAPVLAAGLAAAVTGWPAWATAAPTVTGVVRAATDPATEPAADPTDTTPTVGPTTTEPTTAPPTASAPPKTTTPTPPASTTAPGGPAPATGAPGPAAPAPPTVAPSVATPPSSGPAGGRPGVRMTSDPGIALRAEEVLFDINGTPSALDVRLGNTGRVGAAGRVDVVLPEGVSVTDPPAGCSAAAPGRTRCDLGRVPAGQSATLRLPVAATAEAQRRAPLSGTVVGRLDPGNGRDRQVRMSFRISAAAALATPPVAVPAPAGSQGVLAVGRAAAGDGRDSSQRLAVTLIAGSLLLVVLALVLATISLRRRLNAPAADPAGGPVTSE
ncbi:hypothetical protein ABZ570_13350 [Micromonospora sp. NPDC007271]|uniref:hypothetical protein n=1 Tax=Micromonospora sp. NPDC007271 TaxID=3154587 RepID=UPI003402208F